MMEIKCPRCGKPFANEKALVGHLANHKKRGEQFSVAEEVSKAVHPEGDALRKFVEQYAKALPKISEIQPRRDDRETLRSFFTQVCKSQGIRIECPHCHTKFFPEEEGKG